MQTKLTLRLDEELIKEVKVIANRQGQSVSKMVAVYFSSFRGKPDQKNLQLTPLVKTLKGAWRGKILDRKDYQRYLEKKYL